MSAPTVQHDYVGDRPQPAARPHPHPLFRALKALASLRLTVVLFGLSMALVFFGTLGMTQESIDGAVRHYFRCWFARIDLQGLAEFGKVFLHMDKDTSLHVKLPFPGGYTIGWVMFANLLAAHLVRFKLSWRRSGIILLHLGVIVLLAGEFLTGQMAVETHMRITEGSSSRFAYSLSETELAVVDPSDPNVDQVVVVPGHMVSGAGEGQWIRHPDLPFEFQVVQYFPNAETRDLEPGEAPKADRGLGRQMALEGRPKVKGTDTGGDVDMPACYVALRAPGGESLGTYMLSAALTRGQPVAVGGKTYKIAYRFKRTYKPYEVKLLKAEHDVYPGTNIPKDYASTVVVDDPAHGEHGPIRIWMNHPMYYQGETFYQSGMPNDPRVAVPWTDLQVVRNVAWTFPYFACGMVALGMAFHFLLRLTTFLPKRVARVRPAGRPVDRFERYFPLAVVALTAFYLVGKAMPPSAGADRFDLYGFGQVPVQNGGRVQPLDSVARNNLMVISGKSEYEDSAGRVYPATEWLLCLWADPEKADKFKIFRADHPQLLSLMGLPQRPGSYRYSWAELMPGRGKLEVQAEVAERKDKEKRDSYDQRVLQLFEHMGLYLKLKAKAVPGIMPSDDPKAKWLSEWDAFQEFRKKRTQDFVAQADADVEQELADPQVRQKAIDKFGAQMVAQYVEMRKEDRRNDLVHEAFLKELPENYPAAGKLAQVAEAYQRDKVADFNAAVAEYKEKYTGGVSDTEKTKVGLEARMNYFDPFLQCQVLYLAVAILAALSWLVWREPLRRAAFGLACLTLAVHTLALVARMYIGNRPPVTNLYSSAVFIGWGSLALCLVLERIYRLGVGAFAGGLIGFATLYIARFLASSGDTLEMLQAVLDTNFWLATHVTCVTLGYVTTLVGGVLGLVYIVGGMFTNGLRGEAGKQVAGMMYGSLCFATLMSFTGTVLGGIWADQSWGRFWGWDPKENGAVLVVIWNALILHARWGGLVKARGMAVLAVVGCMWTVWSWFGTNQLGIGLHAYGFDNRLANGCAVTWIALGLVAGLGMVPPRFWASLGPAPQARAA